MRRCESEIDSREFARIQQDAGFGSVASAVLQAGGLPVVRADDPDLSRLKIWGRLASVSGELKWFTPAVFVCVDEDEVYHDRILRLAKNATQHLDQYIRRNSAVRGDGDLRLVDVMLEFSAGAGRVAVADVRMRVLNGTELFDGCMLLLPKDVERLLPHKPNKPHRKVA